jgi:hypothetical protein
VTWFICNGRSLPGIQAWTTNRFAIIVPTDGIGSAPLTMVISRSTTSLSSSNG